MAFSLRRHSGQLIPSPRRRRARQKAATWPVACTPASVRPAKRTRVRSPVSLLSASSSSPCTVRAFGWYWEPAKSVPSYSITARAQRRAMGGVGPSSIVRPARGGSFLDQLDLDDRRGISQAWPDLHDPGVAGAAVG